MFVYTITVYWVNVGVNFNLILYTVDMGVSKNRGTPKSSILIGFSIINHPFWGTVPLFLETPIYVQYLYFHNKRI